jgi:cytosine/uracil/thiamine/allantoin permease
MPWPVDQKRLFGHNSSVQYNKGAEMKTFIVFVAGVIVGAAGITFSDVARVADKGVEAAKSAVQETVKQ